ncbi:MAG: type II toxin-antitoxin system PemK/MazF family toxin [Nitrospirota bacterium]
MTSYERGDIVLVPFPFSNQSATKKRPAVVVSSAPYNATSQDLVILAVTSKVVNTTGIGECLVKDWKHAGLLKPSAIKPALSTIDRTLIYRKLGALSRPDLSAMDKALRALLGLA